MEKEQYKQILEVLKGKNGETVAILADIALQLTRLADVAEWHKERLSADDKRFELERGGML